MKISRLALLVSVFLMPFCLQACEKQDEEVAKSTESFSFGFFTDIHLNANSKNCFAGFNQAITVANTKHLDFILTGGDNCDIDGLNNNTTAHELYGRFADVIKKSPIPFYPAIGNHDRFWGVGKEDPLYCQGLWEKYTGCKRYYSFNHKGWHFIVLDTSNSSVDNEQKQWLSNDLTSTRPDIPTVVIVHVPFLTVYYPALEGRYTNADTFSNFKEIWDMFKGRNLKLVLQGHQHLYEEIKVLGVQFITGGSVCASWWGGPYHGTQEGFLNVKISASNNISWEYVDYGWVVE
jgi:3',5'-cyclic AMP phosphodiesterase CpdA